MSSLHSHFDVECLPTTYGGKVEIPEGTGVALGDLFRLYSKEFESTYKHVNISCSVQLHISNSNRSNSGEQVQNIQLCTFKHFSGKFIWLQFTCS